ncbi:MAG: D-alanine--D-alanine ligase [Clostridia bacterium]|nr:D-alanine--D-alanine ligase [Clostridia bacterium]
MKKQIICVLFGGVSPEHAVSCRSGAMVIEHIDRERFEVLPVGIRRDGAWFLTADCAETVRSGAWETDPASVPVVFSPSRAEGECGLLIDGKWVRPDCIFPVMHGENCEDGSMQGLFKLAGIPFVGCGVASSAVCMDKIYTKMVCTYGGILQADWVAASDISEPAESVADRCEAKLAYPMFVKPANTGSSVGVSKAKDRNALIAAIDEARRYDRRVLIEENIDGYELECAVMGNNAEVVSGIGQVLPTQEFYSYDAKYNDASSALIFDPDFPAETVALLRKTAADVYRLLDCKGLSRVDFFLRKSDGKVIFNEINTLPGFTSISMYPKLMERIGISNTEMITRVIETAFTREEGRVLHG